MSFNHLTFSMHSLARAFAYSGWKCLCFFNLKTLPSVGLSLQTALLRPLPFRTLSLESETMTSSTNSQVSSTHETIVPLEWIEHGVYGGFIITYPRPYSIYLRGTVYHCNTDALVT